MPGRTCHAGSYRDEVDRSERRSFAEDGYAVCRDRIDSSSLANATLAIARVVALAGPRATASGRWSCTLAHDDVPEVYAALHESSFWRELEELVAPAALEHVDAAQLTRNVPPNLVEPGQPHVDLHARGADRPDSFSLLVAILLGDQQQPGDGNVWVWPRTHLLHGEYLEANGPRALLEGGGKLRQVAPGVRLPAPVSVCGRAGDVLVAHPLLGHETGPNHGRRTREAVYFRLRRSDHLARWEECLTSPLLEYNLDDG